MTDNSIETAKLVIIMLVSFGLSMFLNLAIHYPEPPKLCPVPIEHPRDFPTGIK